jgi:5,6,7,8-tetrahydromethanopterin hydro-lyase
MLLGESFVGNGVNAAHVNTVVGERDGPVGVAWATALASPSEGHAPFVAVMQPGLPVKPFTLFVNKARLQHEAHANMTWGAAQAGVAAGVADALAAGDVDEDDVVIAAVWVNSRADDADAVYANNRAATAGALEMGKAGGPNPADVLATRDDTWNPFFRAR